ncbi:alpha/beta hydrolase [Ewingella americana]
MNSKSESVFNTDNIVTESIMIDSDTPGIRLHLRRKYLRSQAAFTADNTLVMIHGATYSSGSLYDVRLDGFSFMDALALRGLNVYAVDVRGYGHSTRPAEMDVPPEDNPPLYGTETGVRDLAQAVEWVRDSLDLPRVQIFGMSWGGSVAGAYTSRNNDKVNRLVVLAPQWLNDQGARLDEGGKLGAYRRVAVGESKMRWVSAAPADKQEELIPAGWFETWAAASLAEDPQSDRYQPAAMRAVNGTVRDVRDFWSVNRPFYRPQEITRPVLLVHGEWDADVPLRLMTAYFTSFTASPERRWVEIGEATHMMLMEKNRLQVFRAVADFYLP